MVSNTIARKGLWVRLPPAAPVDMIAWPVCQAHPPDSTACVDERGLGPAYVYLLGLYLGDGCLTLMRRYVWKLRVCQDAKYVALIDACRAAITEVSGHVPESQPKVGCVEIYSCWKHWLCLFPQHGVGRKHERHIALLEWQRYLVDRYPRQLIAGLIHSDGSRTVNRVRRPLKGQTGVYLYPRYFFTNHSDDIRQLFVETCALIGVESRPNNRWNISVAKRASVEILDSFIGPKR